MRRQTWVSIGRRGTVFAASAAVLCLGGALAARGTGADGGDGYVAVGAAGAGDGRAGPGDELCQAGRELGVRGRGLDDGEVRGRALVEGDEFVR